MGALFYASGVLTGAGLMFLHYREVKKAIEAERLKYQKRIWQLECERQAADCADAFRRGVQKGRYSPATAAERFAKTFEDRRAEFREVR